MSYSVKEIFCSFQGEGMHAGRVAVFCRFAGCNLWSGREADRALAQCQFCDTDFVGTDGSFGGKYAAPDALADAVARCWPADAHAAPGRRWVVLTGGEPLLQVDEALIEALHARGFEVAVETNGTIVAPAGLDWICVSPKAGVSWVQQTGDELKVVVPQPAFDLEALAQMPFKHFLLQPMDGPLLRENTQLAMRLCEQDPRWRLSLQWHKTLGIR